MNMYTHSAERINQILQRNLENIAPAVPALICHQYISESIHDHRVIFIYERTVYKTFDGRKWS